MSIDQLPLPLALRDANPPGEVAFVGGRWYSQTQYVEMLNGGVRARLAAMGEAEREEHVAAAIASRRGLERKDSE
jgi:hypothetical protein